MKSIALEDYTILRLSAMLMVLTLLASCGQKTQVAAVSPKVPSASSPVYPLKVSANGRYLVRPEEHPLSDCRRRSPNAGCQGLGSGCRKYFDDRQAHGFNALWINVLDAGPYYHDSSDDGSTYDGILPFTGHLSGGTDTAHYDLSKPDEAYFTRVDQMLTLAANHGIVVFLDPIETGQWVPTMRNNGPAADYAYGQFLGNRYRHFDNILWLNGNDFNTWKKPADDEVVRAVATGIKSVDPGHLQTIELNVETSSSSDDPTWAPIISVNATYTYSPTYFQMWHSYNHTPLRQPF